MEAYAGKSGTISGKTGKFSRWIFSFTKSVRNSVSNSGMVSSGASSTVCIVASDFQVAMRPSCGSREPTITYLDAIRVPQKYPGKKYFKGEKTGSIPAIHWERTLETFGPSP